MKKIFYSALVLAVIFSFPFTAFADTYYVPDDFPTIQAALDGAANGDVVIVRDGTWTDAGNKNLDFSGKAIALQSENGPNNCIIDCEGDGRGFHFQSQETASSVVDGFTITNAVTHYTGNFPDGWGAGILCTYLSSPTIRNCIITGNQSIGGESGSGAGISCYASASPEITNCVISDNSGVWGGGIYCNFTSMPNITNCTIVGNSARGGGGIYVANSSWPLISDCVMWNNSATYGPQIELVQDSDLTVTYSDVKGGRLRAWVTFDSTLHWEAGNINSDPLFVSGLLGNYYLSQVSSGQAQNSPCLNSGNDLSSNLGFDSLTTRTDQVADSGIVDMGYHSQPVPITPLTRIHLSSPANESGPTSAPTFTWTPDGGMDNVFAVDVALSPTGPFYSTWENLHTPINSESWTMPNTIWNLIPSGSTVYWRVRGADLTVSPLTIVTSDEVWWFFKQ
jgi:parallel beta-helix repeat protein